MEIDGNEMKNLQIALVIKAWKSFPWIHRAGVEREPEHLHKRRLNSRQSLSAALPHYTLITDECVCDGRTDPANLGLRAVKRVQNPS